MRLFLHTFVGAWFTDGSAEYRHISVNIESICPPEILYLILRFAVGRDGVKALLPFTKINWRWRHVALGNPSLWTIIRLAQMTPRLLDMTLTRARNQLFEVYVDWMYDLNRFARLWKFVDRIEALYFTTGFGVLHSLLSSLGPAPNLKILYLQPMTTRLGGARPLVNLAAMFSGCFPSLRDLSLPNTDTWPIGLFKRLTSFECGDHGYHPIPPDRVLDILRESPSIESIRLMGSCTIPPEFQQPAIPLLSLKECALVGPGTTTLIRFMTIPATAHVSLRRLRNAEDGAMFARFDDFSLAPGLHVLDEVAAVSFSANGLRFQFQAKNINGGVLEDTVDELGWLQGNSTVFDVLLTDALHRTRTRPGFRMTKVLKVALGCGRAWGLGTSRYNLDIMDCIRCLPQVEELDLLEFPWRTLCSALLSLGDDPNTQGSPQNVKRLHIDSPLLPSPRPLLLRLDKLLTNREGRGVPFHSIKVVIKCEMLIPAADHCAFLASWERLVEGDVRLEYKKWPCKPRRRNIRDEDEDRWDSDEKDRNDKDDEGRCVGWDGWPEEWPETVEEMRKGRWNS